MKYRLVALDLDDTLLNSDGAISSENMDVLGRILREGVILVLATGRPYGSALSFARRLSLTSPLITYNGALVRFPEHGDILEHLPVSTEDTCRIIRLADEFGIHINLYIDDQLYARETNEYTDAYDRRTGMKTEAVGDLEAFINARQEPSTKVLAIERREDLLASFAEQARKELSERLHITYSRDYFLEFMDHRVSKGRSLQRVVEHYGLDRSEVLACGDGQNDLDMLTYAGLGAAVANAHPQVKEEVECVVASNDQNGVAELLRGKVLAGQGSS